MGIVILSLMTWVSITCHRKVEKLVVDDEILTFISVKKYQVWNNGIINADIPISLYVLQNKINTNKEKTIITSVLKRRNLITTSSEYLNKNYSIPLAYHNIFNKLIHFIETNNLKLEYYNKTIKSTGIKTKIPLSYTLEDMIAIDTNQCH